MSGELHPGTPTLVAPYSKRPCFYYSALEEDKGAWNQGDEELFIEDETGRAIVELAGATVQVDYDHEAHGLPLKREGILAPDCRGGCASRARRA